MTQAITRTFGKMQVLQRTATGPDVFSPFCGLTNVTANFSKQLNETLVPSCDDPDAASWPERDVDSRSVTFTGTGVFAGQWAARIRAAFESNEPVFLRFMNNHPVSASVGDAATNVANDVGFWSGLFHLSSHNLQGQRGTRWQSEVTFESHGPVTFTAAANGTPQV